MYNNYASTKTSYGWQRISFCKCPNSYTIWKIRCVTDQLWTTIFFPSMSWKRSKPMLTWNYGSISITFRTSWSWNQCRVAWIIIYKCTGRACFSPDPAIETFNFLWKSIDVWTKQDYQTSYRRNFIPLQVVQKGRNTAPQDPKFLIKESAAFRLTHPSTDWKVLESMSWDQKAHPFLYHEWNPQWPTRFQFVTYIGDDHQQSNHVLWI